MRAGSCRCALAKHDITCSAGGSLALQAQFAEKLADPKHLHVHQQLTALPRLRKGRPWLLNPQFEPRNLETLNSCLTFSLP
jgi:hypothetical protein